jgi:hypothetical protein
MDYNERRLNKMEEEKNQQMVPEETKTTEDIGEGIQSKTPTLYEQTNAAAERVERANAKTEELLYRQEELYEKQKLGGRAEAGQPNISEEDKKKEAAIDFWKGTPVADAIKRYGPPNG